MNLNRIEKSKNVQRQNHCDNRQITVFYLYNSPRGGITKEDDFRYEQSYAFYGLDCIDRFNIKASYSDKGFENTLLTYLLNKLGSFVQKTVNIPANFSQIIVLCKELKKADIIFATAQRCGIPLVIFKSLKIIKRPIVFTSIGFSQWLKTLKNRYTHHFFCKIFKTVDKIVCYSQRERIELIEYLHLPEEKVEFVPFCVPTEYFRPSDNSKTENFILSIGADNYRDYRTLFKAIEGLNINLTLITFPKNVKGLSVPKNVEICYEVPFNQIKDFYSRCLLVAIPVKENSYSGGTTSVLQAMAMGKAVIVSKTGAIENGYSLNDKENCVLVNPGNVKELRQAILYLLNNPKEMVRIGNNARRTVEKWHTWHRYVGNLARIFAKVYLQDEHFDSSTALERTLDLSVKMHWRNLG